MKLVLNGGGVGKAVESARKLLNGIIDHNKKILYVPFAWPDPMFSGSLEFMTDELSDIDKAGIDMVSTPEELMGKDFCEYACLYIGGGNTYKLLGCLKTSGAYEKIRQYLLEDDGIVYGGSAGAIIFGKDLDSCNTDDENSVGLVDHTGFNMINGYSLLCHYRSREPERTEVSRRYLLELSKVKPIFAIPEEDTIYVDDDMIKFVGPRLYSEFVNGTEKMKYCDDEIVLVPYVDEDYEFVYEVKKNAYKKYVEECWGEWIEEDQRTYFEKFIRDVRNNAFIIMNGTEKIGFYNGEVTKSGNYEIGNICIIPEYQGKGIGTKILKEKLEENKGRDIEIQYFKQNPVGTLYERLGFVPNGETRYHYQMIKYGKKEES